MAKDNNPEGQRQSYGKTKASGTPPMGKEKTDSSTPSKFAQGGSKNHMSGPNHAGPQTPGESTQGGAKNAKPYNGGGSGHMFGPQHADPQQPGVSGHTTSGSGQKFAAGGKGSNNKMFGYTGSSPAKPA